MIYIGQPYSNPSSAIREFRAEMGAAVAAVLAEQGEAVFAPVPLGCALVPYLPKELVASHEFWMSQDLPILAGCRALYVIELDGWQESRGLAEEIAFAEGMGMPVIHIAAGSGVYEAALARVQQKAAA